MATFGTRLPRSKRLRAMLRSRRLGNAAIAEVTGSLRPRVRTIAQGSVRRGCRDWCGRVWGGSSKPAAGTGGAGPRKAVETPSKVPATTKQASPGVQAIPKGYVGLGALKSTWGANNTTRAPSYLPGAGRGLAWFPVRATNSARQVTGYAMYADASPPYSAAEQIAMLGFGIDSPVDKAQVASGSTCAVLRSATLQKMLGTPYEAVIVQPTSYTNGIPVTETTVFATDGPSCSSPHLSQAHAGTPAAAISTVATSGAARWTASEQASYLTSCHHLALRGLPGVTTAQRDRYWMRRFIPSIRCAPLVGTVSAHDLLSHGWVLRRPANYAEAVPNREVESLAVVVAIAFGDWNEAADHRVLGRHDAE